MPDIQTAPIEAQVRRFFEAFAQASDTLDTGTLAGCFAEVFLAADADGARPLPVQAFLQALPKRAQMFADAGIGRARLDSVTCQILDDHYVLARTNWTAPRTGGGDPVPLSSSFLLHRGGGGLRIVVYLNHQGPPQAAART